MNKFDDANFIILMETHTSGSRAAGIVRKIGLKGNFIQEAEGHAGGSWCLWDTDWWKVEVLAHSPQFIHMKVQFKDLGH